MRKSAALALCLLCCFLLNGCWDYRGLDDIDIVTGVAVDRDGDTGIYQLTFEIVDTQNSGEDGTAALYVESQGETLFDAIRNAKKRLINKLYGGNMQTLIISRQIAGIDGISVILEELLRDGEPRETMSVVISREETARELLLTRGLDSKIISYEIHEMVQEDSRVTAASMNVPLYAAYNAVKGAGNVLVLPAVQCTQNGEDTVAEGNGIALFQQDRMTGFLTAGQTKNYLFIQDEIKGGVISFPVDQSGESISLEIKESRTKKDVRAAEGQVTVSLSIAIQLNVMEMKGQLSLAQAQDRKRLEGMIEEYLEKTVTDFFQEAQQQQKRDIFGLGRLIYQKDPALWSRLEADWDDLFQQAEVHVDFDAFILSSGVLKDY